MSDVRNVPLPKGGSLEVTTTPAFYDALRKHLMLQPTQPVTDDHIRMFIFGVVSGAVDKAETSHIDSSVKEHVMDIIKDDKATE